MLASSLVQGAEEAGHRAEIIDLNETIAGGFLRDCRECRQDDGSCSIDDGYSHLLQGQVLESDAIIYATPLYWYGVAAILKNFFDRMVCYTSGSHPAHERTTAGLVGKRSALLISSEESYSGSSLGVVAQIQEMSRYLHHEFVGIVHGIGNKRGEVADDPSDPVAAARLLGFDLFNARFSDSRIDTTRANAVWSPHRRDGEGVYEDT